MLFADLRVWLIDSVPRRPAPVVVWLGRGVMMNAHHGEQLLPPMLGVLLL